MIGTSSRLKLASRAHLVVEPHPCGCIIGTFAGEPIGEVVTDRFGRHFVYAGLASVRSDGRYNIETLKTGEFIVEPGLLYRLESAQPHPRLPRASFSRWLALRGIEPPVAFILVTSLVTAVVVGVILAAS